MADTADDAFSPQADPEGPVFLQMPRIKPVLPPLSFYQNPSHDTPLKPPCA
jgi:hypothetical protein